MIECDVEESVPIPTSTSANYIDVRLKAKAACESAKLLQEHGLQEEKLTEPDREELRQATHSLLKNLAESNVANYPAGAVTPASIIYVNEVLSQYDMEIVKDAKRLRAYVTNKLVIESENNDPRIRMKALELLGKISDVGLFTERSEVTVNNKSTIELENTLRQKLRKLMGTETAENAEIIENNTTELEFVPLPPAPDVVIDAESALAGL